MAIHARAHGKPVGQDRLTYSGRYGTSRALDLNSNTTGTSAVGSISRPGQWRTMEQTCPVVSFGSRALFDHVRGAQYSVEAHESCPGRIVDAVREMSFERLRRDFGDVVSDAFSAVRYGFAPMEITYRHEDGLVWIDDLSLRPPYTIDLHTIDRTDSGWYECTQRYYARGGMQVAQYGEPGKAGQGVLWWVQHGDAGSPLGEGFYRPLYALYQEWADAMHIRRIAVQKASLGVYTVQIREGSVVDDDHLSDAEDRIGDCTTGEKSVLVLPPWVAEHGWDFSEPEAINALTQVIDDIETRKLMFFGAQYAARGTTSGHGSYSASKSDTTELAGNRDAFLKWFCRSFQFVIDHFVQINFGEQRHYPYLIGEVKGTMSTTEFIASLTQAANGSLIRITDDVRASVRRALQQEPEPDDIEEQIAARTPPALRDAPQAAGADDDKTAESVDDAPDERAPEGTRGKDGTKAMTAACECVHFEDGVRRPPKPGGQEPRKGPGGRDLSRLERLVNWRKIEFTLDSSTQSLLGLWQDAQALIAKALLDAVPDTWETPAELAKLLQNAAVPTPTIQRIRAMFQRKVDYIAATAAETVRSEHEQQTGATSFTGVSLGEYQDIAVDQMAADVVDDTRTQLVRATITIQAPSKGAIFQLLREAASELSEAEGRVSAPLVTSEVFARARLAEVERLVEETQDAPKAVHYSAILDEASCEECAAADQLYGEETGEPIPWGSDLMAEMMPPYQRCLGGVRCRCQLVWRW